ncbi:MAG: 50S ribosomal protein L18e [Candidatus Pacearchaeota archaeon]|nr:MAG: 50S ribosomal protein L18e [Candidatus Pacearchaeota archaeon]
MKKISKTRIRKRISKKTDPEVKDLVIFLNKQKKPLWHQTAKYLSRPRKKAISVNIDKINKLTEGDEVVIVPGKILSRGTLNHKLIIAAFKFSDKAKKRLTKKAELLSIKELAEKISKFKGLNVRIII